LTGERKASGWLGRTFSALGREHYLFNEDKPVTDPGRRGCLWFVIALCSISMLIGGVESVAFRMKDQSWWDIFTSWNDCWGWFAANVVTWLVLLISTRARRKP
jgi:hypothetical protein